MSSIGKLAAGSSLAALSSLRSSVRMFFVAEGGRASRERADSHLLHLLRCDLAAAAWFIESVMLFSLLGAAAATLAAVLFLPGRWESCGYCDRPLRWWLLVQAFLQLLQVPVRFGLFTDVRAARHSSRPLGDGEVEMAVIRHTSTPAWRFSRTVSLAIYGWLVLGVVWLIHSGPCSGSCPGLRPLTAAIVFLSGARALVAVSIFRSLFRRVRPLEEPTRRPRAATPEEVAALPVIRLGRGGAAAAEASCSCAVCLSDFAEGDLLRKLPCKHHFHRHCVDAWLSRCDKCPLCMHQVGEECTSGWAHAKVQ